MSNQPTRCRIAGSSPEKPFPAVYATAAVNTDVVITLPATANQCWVIGLGGLVFSYSGGTIGTGTLNISTSPDGIAGYTVRNSFDITSLGLAPVPFPKPFKFPVGAAVKITLVAAGAAVIGKLNLTDYWYESDTDPAF